MQYGRYNIGLQRLGGGGGGGGIIGGNAMYGEGVLYSR